MNTLAFTTPEHPRLLFPTIGRLIHLEVREE